LFLPIYLVVSLAAIVLNASAFKPLPPSASCLNSYQDFLSGVVFHHKRDYNKYLRLSSLTRNNKTGGALMFKSNQPQFSPLFLVLACCFVVLLLLANIIAGKMANFFGITLPAAVILFPLTYIFGDVLTEVYGFSKARLIIWLGFGANLLMAAVFLLTIALPYPDFWQGQTAFAAVLGLTPRIVVASLLAYLVGELVNAAVLSRLKVKTKGRNLWLRTIGSTVAGEGIDTVLFIAIAFGGTMPLGVLGTMMLAQYLWKIAYETAVTPLTYQVVRWVKRQEQLDVYDTKVKYSPFGWEV
jgi:uncharacterized integral membrane protein (TIGR00697 family)